MSSSLLWSILLFFAGLTTSLLLMPVLIKMAQRRGFMSPIDFRRKQKEQTPLLGGVSLFVAVGLASFIVADKDIIKIFICSAPIFLVGLFDDRLQLGSKAKALVHVFSVFLWLSWMPESSFWMLKFGIPTIMVTGFMAFWMIGLINAMNMIDGMDTEAGGVSLIATISLLVIFGGSSSALPLLALSGALIGFLYYNKAPAKIYLGDCGSNFLGFYLAAMSLSLPISNIGASFFLVPLFIFAVPQMDAVLAIFRRFKSSSSLFGADHDHIHHKLLKVGFNKFQSASIIHAVAVYSGVAAYLNYQMAGGVNLFLVNALAISGMLFVLVSIHFLEYRQAKQVSMASRSLIASHLDVKSDTDMDLDIYYAVVYDLLPYYKELQLRGISEVNEFINNFSIFVKEHHENSEFIQFGSYTLISLHKAKYSTKVNKVELISKYYSFLKDFSVVKSESKIPWGMNFYSHRSKGEEFIKKFGLSPKAGSVVELKKIA